MIRSKQSLAFEAYWNSIRKGQDLPPFTAFDPLQISDLIPNLYELKLPHRDHLQADIRFAGGDVVETAHQEVTNTDFFSYLEQSSIEPTMERIKALADHPCGLCQINMMTLHGGSGVELELTGFPVLCPDNDIFLVGTVVALEKEDSTDLSSVNTLDVSEDRMWIDIGNGVPLID